MAYSGFATAAADEVTRLHQLVEDLELANGTLNEKLIESHLETKALRRASDEWRGQVVLDQKAMVLEDKTSEAQERQLVGAAAPEGSGLDKKPWVDGMSSACGLGQGDQQRDRSEESLRTDETSKDGGQGEELSLRGPGQGLTAHCSSSVGGGRLEEAGRASAGTSVDARGGEKSQPARDPGCEPDQETSTRPSQENVYASAVSPSSPSRVLRRLPSISEGPDEQAELIDALRGQVDQLRLEAQRAGSVTSLPGGARRGTRSAELRDCRRRGSSKHSSDEDSNSDNSNDDSINANATGSSGLENCPPPTTSRKKAGEERRSSPVGDSDISVDDGQTIRMLQARVRDLSAELMTANLGLLTLREQARTDQDEMVRLQRENLSSHRLGLNSAMVAAAAARASATAASPGARADCQRCGYSPRARADEDSGCLNHDGLRWLHGLWLRLANGLGGEQRRNGETERFRGERWRYGSAGYEWGRGEGNILQFDVDERASLLQKEEEEEEEVKHNY